MDDEGAEQVGEAIDALQEIEERNPVEFAKLLDMIRDSLLRCRCEKVSQDD